MPQVKKKSFIQKNGLIAVWSMAGFMAMGYIGFLATGTGSQNPSATVVAQNGAAASITPVQQEIAALRAHVKELTSREANTSRKLSLIEEALGPNTAALPEQQILGNNKKLPQVALVAPLPAKSGPEKSNNVSINVLPLTADDKISELSNTIEIQHYGIDLASARSISSLKRHWEFLKKSNSHLVSGLKPHFVDKGTPDLPLFSLVVGPFEKMSDARGHCAKLTKASIECQETQFYDKTMGKIHTAGNNSNR